MKKFKPYLITIGVTTLLAEVVAIVLLLIGADSVAVLDPAVTRAEKDSVIIHVDSSVIAAKDSSSISEMKDSASVTSNSSNQRIKVDSIGILRSLWEEEKKKNQLLEKSLGRQRAVADSAKTKDRKNMAQLLETMKADDAARILESLDDSEAKMVLVLIKKRQAGKILSALDPNKAIKIMR